MSGKLIIFSAPSGAGKTTIVKHILNHPEINLEFSVSACSRKKREGEIDGKDYYFLSAEEFITRKENDEFLEWEEVYKDNFYGTLKSEVHRIWAKGNNVLFDVDVMGGINIKTHYGDKALLIFVMPPSLDELERRLRSRNTESDESVKERISKAETEISFSDKFDIVLVNDNLDIAKVEAETIILNFLKS